jgi:hypothetical protein
MSADWASTKRPSPYDRGVASNGGVSSMPSTQKDRREPPLTSMPGEVGVELNTCAALMEAS